MLDILSLLTLAATSVATISNVLLVAKRYKDIKEMKEMKDIKEMKMDIHDTKIVDADKILKELTVKNNGILPLSNEEIEQFEKLADKINLELEVSEDDVI